MPEDLNSIARAIEKGFANVNAHHKKNGNGNLIALFSTVILSLGAIGFSMISGVSERSDLLAKFQSERSNMRAEFQKERQADLDEKLQKEIEDLAALIAQRFDDNEAASVERNDRQQAQLDHFASWFKAPALKNNDEQ